jgi:hypothetical protein
MWEESGNVLKELIKPKNIFSMNAITGSGNTTLTILPQSVDLSLTMITEASGLLTSYS